MDESQEMRAERPSLIPHPSSLIPHPSTLMPSSLNPPMHYRPLGTTGLHVSAVSFGAGPVSGLMTGPPRPEQAAVVRHAIACGINWFDTAAGYGAGESETNLGIALKEIRSDPDAAVVAVAG